ncbi:Eukaryotic translation initiation factor 2D [Hypsibius exemplaris]|uniref:Eukaryotic translation initiation factor 2D n=1 Tax=Hypsibius exemplaris TaxID=2072580 RepID=A0A9X6NGQ7_HYPEX|nr:Eukaryotic translation initiation factor 2D [Hypsibius exemplaris]
MFKHPLRIKSQTVVKKSERKALLDQLSAVYPSFTGRDVQSDLFPDGEDIKTLKVVAASPTAAPASGPKNPKDAAITPDTFVVYCNAKTQPFFVSFDVPSNGCAKKAFRNIILPTVYALWKCPKLFPLNFSTVPEVVGKMQNGADLMLAGVTVSESVTELVRNGVETETFLPYASVTVLGSNLPIAIGSLMMDLAELRSRLAPGGELKGKLLKTCHIAGDELWALGDKSLQPVEPLPPAPFSGELSAGGNSEKASTSAADTLLDALMPLGLAGGGSEAGLPVEISEDDMDALFQRVLAITLKSKFSDGKLPVLASTLNSQMMLIGRRVSPHSLDIKHTSYRKFAKFLEEMESDCLLTISKVKEGVQAVASVVWKHPAFADVEALPDEPSASGPSVKIPSSIRQVYIVNGKTASLFGAVDPNMKKGYEFRSTEGVREVLTTYVKSKDLISKTDSKVINLDQTLMDIAVNKTVSFKGEWPMKWGEVFDKVLKEMSTNHEVVFTNGGSVELRGKLVPMDVKVEKKAGNKLVTAIRNLEGLGMDPAEIARELQQVVGATVNVREEPGGQHSVTVQGDQTKLLDKFFFQTLAMPKKFVTGLEKPGKKG